MYVRDHSYKFQLRNIFFLIFICHMSSKAGPFSKTSLVWMRGFWLVKKAKKSAMLDFSGFWLVEKQQWRHTGSAKGWKWVSCLAYGNCARDARGSHRCPCPVCVLRNALGFHFRLRFRMLRLKTEETPVFCVCKQKQEFIATEAIQGSRSIQTNQERQGIFQ